MHVRMAVYPLRCLNHDNLWQLQQKLNSSATATWPLAMVTVSCSTGSQLKREKSRKWPRRCPPNRQVFWVYAFHSLAPREKRAGLEVIRASPRGRERCPAPSCPGGSGDERKADVHFGPSGFQGTEPPVFLHGGSPDFLGSIHRA